MGGRKANPARSRAWRMAEMQTRLAGENRQDMKRVFSILLAAIVVVTLYMLVFEREAVLALAAGDDRAQAASDAAPVPEAATLDVAAAIEVVAMRSSASVIDRAVLVRGQTQAARQVEVRAETSGQVISEPLRKGSSVDAGQLLCEIDPGTRGVALREAEARLAQARTGIPEAEARVAEARARLEEAEINDRAAARLVEDGFASQSRVASVRAAAESARAGVTTAESGLEAAKAGISSAEAAVAAAQREIEQLKITAPFEGLLESDTAETGSLLQPGALCATIIQLDPIKLVGFVPETQIDAVATGAMAGARLASGREVIGEVTFVSRSADPTTRTFRVEVEVDNGDASIRDGQTVEIAIASDGTAAHLLPQSALTLDNAGRLGVRLVGGDRTVAFAPVTLLRDTTDGVWVDGLAEDVSVIVVGQEYVTEGVAVRPTYREASR